MRRDHEQVRVQAVVGRGRVPRPDVREALRHPGTAPRNARRVQNSRREAAPTGRPADHAHHARGVLAVAASVSSMCTPRSVAQPVASDRVTMTRLCGRDPACPPARGGCRAHLPENAARSRPRSRRSQANSSDREAIACRSTTPSSARIWRRTYGDAECIVNVERNRRYSFREYHLLTNRIVNMMRERLGLRRGDTWLCILHNDNLSLLSFFTAYKGEAGRLLHQHDRHAGGPGPPDRAGQAQGRVHRARAAADAPRAAAGSTA